ncbi:hypothetical protein ACFSJ3_05530 [Corallincola platygyrae]|uniref:Uncharacterized protein n=1 Tax=Corallincola platygyrae TaxID=1193278 RepID=A0ABW4XL00_9GAMM
MSSQTLNRVLWGLCGLGALLVCVGLAMAIWTDISVTMGVKGILIISLTIGAGLFLLIPSKIYLTLLLMKNK